MSRRLNNSQPLILAPICRALPIQPDHQCNHASGPADQTSTYLAPRNNSPFHSSGPLLLSQLDLNRIPPPPLPLRQWLLPRLANLSSSPISTTSPTRLRNEHTVPLQVFLNRPHVPLDPPNLKILRSPQRNSVLGQTRRGRKELHLASSLGASAPHLSGSGERRFAIGHIEQIKSKGDLIWKPKTR